MSSVRSASNFLLAREGRQALISAAVQQARRSTIFLSLNIPGPDKSPPGSAVLFHSIRCDLVSTFTQLAIVEEGRDALGRFLVATIDADARELKKHCIELETASTAGRLVDLDVYSAQGTQVDRGSLAQPGRTCLVCTQSAADCIRQQTHSFNEVIGKVNELLAPFVS